MTIARTIADQPSLITEPVVRFRDVVKTYDDDGLKVTAINGISFDIRRQCFAMIVGPSGSGKTTLLNLIGCIDTPTAGHIDVCSQDVATLADNAVTDFRAHHLGFIFQNFNLFPVLSAYENVEYPCCCSEWRRQSGETVRWPCLNL